MNNSRSSVDRIKKMYPTGTRIELISTMDDMQGVEKGTRGTVIGTDDAGTIHMKWDNGRELGLIPGHNKTFHMLIYFDTSYLAKVPKVLTDIYRKECLDEINKNVSPIFLNTIFKPVFNKSIQNVITLIHFNNKDKGISPKDQIDRFVYTVFNALGDSNNRNNLVKSLRTVKLGQA